MNTCADSTNPTPTPIDESILTPEMVVTWFAERGLTISVARVREGIRNKEIPGYQVGRWYMTPLPWLHRWLYGPAPEGDPSAAPPKPVIVSMIHRSERWEATG